MHTAYTASDSWLMNWQGAEGIERDANKAASATQKEGAKGSMAAMKVYI